MGRGRLIKVISIFLTGLFCFEMIMLVWVNLTQMEYHMGYDASSYFLKAFEMYKQKSLFVSNWNEQTTMYIDSPVPLAGLLTPLFKNISLAYGVANIALIIVILGVMNGIMKEIGTEGIARKVILCMTLCPYVKPNVANLGYFQCVLTSSSCYSVKIIISLCFVWCFLKLIKEKEFSKLEYTYCFIICLLIFISAISSTYHILITVLLPCFLVGMVLAFMANDIQFFRSKAMIFLYGNFILSIAGKWVGTNFFKFISRESNIPLVGMEDFWKNLGSIFLGYIELLAGMKYESNEVAMSVNGLNYLCGWIVAFATMMGFVWALKQIKINKELLVLSGIVISNVLIFSFVYMTYASKVFEIRYLIWPFFCVLICFGKFISDLDNGLLLKKFGIVTVSLSVLLLSVFSYKNWMKDKIDIKLMDDIKNCVSEIDCPVVWTYDLVVLGRNMRVYDTEKIYKVLSIDTESEEYSFHHWGDYTYYDNAEDYLGSVILLTSSSGYEEIPGILKENMILYKEIENLKIFIGNEKIIQEVCD